MLTITYYEIVTLHSIPELYLVFHQDWVLDTYTEEKNKERVRGAQGILSRTRNFKPFSSIPLCALVM